MVYEGGCIKDTCSSSDQNPAVACLLWRILLHRSTQLPSNAQCMVRSILTNPYSAKSRQPNNRPVQLGYKSSLNKPFKFGKVHA